ncbi:MAG TPA: PQQ-binding-like beta-propeller repeat protein, partial [Candidatus Obscuribacterales bacterium]
FGAGGSLTSPVVAADGSIYLGAGDGKVYALSSSGTAKGGFSFSAVGAISSTTALSADGSRLYIGSDDGKLYAVNTSSGAVVWSYATGAAIRSSPALDSQGNLYFGSNDNKLYSLDVDGGLRSGFPVTTGGAISSSPAIDSQGRIFAQSQDGKLYGLTSAGASLSGFPVSVGVSGNSPAIGSDGTVYTTADNLRAINPASGALKWNSTLCRTNPVLDGEGYVLCANAGGNFTVLRVNPANGEAASIFALAGYYLHQLAAGGDGIMYFGADDGKFYALNPDYSTKWVYDVGGTVSSSPAVLANGIVYVSSNNNTLYALQSGVSIGDGAVQGLASSWARFKGNNAGNGRQ